jgi:hypothetical protein
MLTVNINLGTGHSARLGHNIQWRKLVLFSQLM